MLTEFYSYFFFNVISIVETVFGGKPSTSLAISSEPITTSLTSTISCKNFLLVISATSTALEICLPLA